MWADRGRGGARDREEEGKEEEELTSKVSISSSSSSPFRLFVSIALSPPAPVFPAPPVCAIVSHVLCGNAAGKEEEEGGAAEERPSTGSFVWTGERRAGE
jgi:hypothetical protein